ncbi:MAG: leucine-rich repeat domain-containing protein [Bacteroidetes bacterium]|nr:leucine-rich repeat domain-containing protein [Bacteroidota bacterium]
MKKIIYIAISFVFTFALQAQSKKGKTKVVDPPDVKPITSEKELSEHLITKFSKADRVEYDDLISAKLDPTIVTSLKLRKQGLTEIPSDLSKFVNLIELDLSDNEITDFTSKLNGLPNLQVINLSGNKLTTIPTDICNLKGLKTLNLSSNKITSGSISCLTELERLYLNNNLFETLPTGITEIQSLKSIYLHSNKLTALDEGLLKLNNLQVLFVQLNKIAIEPNSFKHNLILNYMFIPQNINNTQLYKYIKETDYTNVLNNNLPETNELNNFITNSNDLDGLKKKTYQEITKYFALRSSFGAGGYIDHLIDYASPDAGLNFELEYCKNKNAFGTGFGLVNWEEPVIGFYYKRHFRHIERKFRPYVKLGLQNDFDSMSLITKLGTDFYPSKFIGFFTEVGIEYTGHINAGLIFRFPR